MELKEKYKDHSFLYKSLIDLTKEQEGIFVSKTHKVDDKLYKVFTYTHANYSNYSLNDVSFESRGITFEVNNDHEFLRLASLPMPKFFNYLENPYVENMGDAKVVLAMVKEDGSLASTYLHNGEVKLKSKSTPLSEYAVWFNSFLNKQKKLKTFLQDMEDKSFTVNLEYTAPDNQIVLKYEKTKLIILNVRSRITGKYIPYLELYELLKDYGIEDFLVKNHTEYVGMEICDFSKIVYEMSNIEGFVVLLDNGCWVKLKTNWYSNRHNSLERLSPFTKKGKRELFFLTLEDKVDDMRQVFSGNDFMLEVLDISERFLSDFIHETEMLTNKFIEKHKNSSPKEIYLDSKNFFDEFLQADYALKKCRGLDASLEMQMYYAAHASKFNRFNNLWKDLKENIE